MTEPAQMPRTELPGDMPFVPVEAACDEGDEPDTDVELADEQGGPGDGTQLSGSET